MIWLDLIIMIFKSKRRMMEGEEEKGNEEKRRMEGKGVMR